MFLPSLPISSEWDNLPFILSSPKLLLCLFMILLCLFHFIKENFIRLIHFNQTSSFRNFITQQTTRHRKTLPKNAAYSIQFSSVQLERVFLKMQRIQFNSVQYSWSGSSSLQSLNNLCKRRPCIRILVPTIPNERCIPLRTRIWNWQSLLMRMHHHRDLSFIPFR